MFDNLTPKEKETVAKAYGSYKLQTDPETVADWYNDLDADLKKTAAKAA